MPESALVERVAAAVHAKRKYTQVEPAFIHALALQECAKGWPFKEAVKQVSARLHQTGSAYFRTAPDYAGLTREVNALPADLHHPDTVAFCRRTMGLHASTAERLPILETFFRQTLAEIAPIQSVLDLACGFTPLSAAWMPLAPSANYYGVDIFADMTAFAQRFLQHAGFSAEIRAGDISQAAGFPQAHVAYLLKTLPCLEQAYAGISASILDSVPAEHLLISYPIRSLGGRAKGMRQTYAAQFDLLMAGRAWCVRRFDFETELAFLVSR